MGERVPEMRLFGGVERSLHAHLDESFEVPAHRLSPKSGRLGGLAPHLRELASPWFAGAMATSERYGSMVQVARVSVLVALGAVALCVALAVVVVWLSVSYADVRVIPYIVQTDAHGYVVPIGPAERAAAPDVRVQMSAVARWVLALRRVTGDPSSQRTFVQEAFYFLAPKSPATSKVREWYAEQNPMGQGVRPVNVEIVRVAPLESGRDFSIEWTEETAGSETSGPVKHLYSAVVSVVVSPTQKLKDVIRNPSGVFIHDFSVSMLQ